MFHPSNPYRFDLSTCQTQPCQAKHSRSSQSRSVASGGMLIFALLLSLITSAFEDFLWQIRHGSIPVVEGTTVDDRVRRWTRCGVEKKMEDSVSHEGMSVEHSYYLLYQTSSL